MSNNGEIIVSHVTKDYGSGKGIFDVSLSVKKGEVFGFLGPNGAGKTTTIRNLLGFIQPQQGTCTIRNLPCFEQACQIQKFLGYLAGEIAFLDDITGKKFLEFIADMKGMKNHSRMQELLEMFELNPSGRIKKMSKGMKQKLGIVIAFMNEPEILILDEPTSGLDPLMQNRFIELITEEKKKGTTIFMSSHMFDEIERTCDRTAIIREGKIVAIEEMTEFKSKKRKNFVLTFADAITAEQFELNGFEIKERNKNTVTISVKSNLPEFLHQISAYPVLDMETRTQSLEELFLHFYDKNEATSAQGGYSL